MTNKPLYIDVHILQTVPPSCINRDDTGSPKTARFGGVRRARISSQAWKKAVRDEFPAFLDKDEIGLRTKDAVGLIAEYIHAGLPEVTEEDALAMAVGALKATGIAVKDANETGYLLFISRLQAQALAQLAVDAKANDGKIAAKEAKAILNVKENPELNAIDIALFGRMVADAPNLNVDASVQVAHAIGIEEAGTEFDYFTAMDDRSPEDEAGAGMIGTVEFLSSTLYRYATLDVYHLFENLGTVEATTRAIEAFLKAFVRSMPTGKQNTFANRTVPSAVVIQLRDSQPVSLVNAFEKPVRAYGEKSTIAVAFERLIAQAQATDEAFGLTPLAAYVTCGSPDIVTLADQLGEQKDLNEALSVTSSAARAYLSGQGLETEGQG